ncbi:inositol monophosphatase family protein [Croceicoccus mobilis]|uniref:Inositol monophosphatase n=1 Tax=Croceicoccus mobilis TaxID=1703339 RepID=A0A916Z644_9SPHN|nr:inositol monophosphatase family protein [Croceicoccus mobilis]GGD78420.1 inositol monophosphatase [Croceicoccus mobilis]
MSALETAVADLMRDVAAKAIMPRYQSLSAGEIIEKAEDDVVTIADRESEAMLAEGLAKILPEAAIVGEESVHADASVMDRRGADLCWIIDPLDGTNNFAKGKPPFGIIIALAEKGETHAGWLWDPLQDRICFAERGKGAFVNGERIAARETGEDMPVAAISTIFMDEAQRHQVKQNIAPYFQLVDIPRCAAEQYPRLALGVNDVSVFQRTLAWDHAAGVLWLNEAGGRAARLDGSAYRPDQDGTGLLAAASPALWDKLAACIPD